MARPDRRRLQDMTAAELAPLERLLDPQYPERLADVATVLYIELLNHAHTVEAAAPLALALTEAVRDELGGQRMYVTKGLQLTLSKRDMEIYDAFNGRNQHLVARQFNLCEERVRQILRRVQAARTAELQRTLPLEQPAG
ncbi:MAG: transcriptional regulator [Burkholderiaceae bacterium]|nr:transcriptional regulator [Burkholderiaceae bacterium]